MTYKNEIVWFCSLITFWKHWLKMKLCKNLRPRTLSPFSVNSESVGNTPTYQCSHSRSLATTPCQTLASAQPGAIWAATNGRRLPPWNELALFSPLALLVRPCPVLSSLTTRHLLIQVSHHTQNSSFPHTWAVWTFKGVFYMHVIWIHITVILLWLLNGPK